MNILKVPGSICYLIEETDMSDVKIKISMNVLLKIFEILDYGYDCLTQSNHNSQLPQRFSDRAFNQKK